jgi:hypothetical protein
VKVELVQQRKKGEKEKGKMVGMRKKEKIR